MKKLGKFFDWQSFSQDKAFVCVGCREWTENRVPDDPQTAEHRGTRVEAVIVSDGTPYGDENVTNLYEKLTFKVPRDISIPVNTEIHPKGVVASIYGDYHNKLSCKAEDIVFSTK